MSDSIGECLIQDAMAHKPAAKGDEPGDCPQPQNISAAICTELNRLHCNGWPGFHSLVLLRASKGTLLVFPSRRLVSGSGGGRGGRRLRCLWIGQDAHKLQIDSRRSRFSGARQESRPHLHTCRSSVRYWMASLKCVESTFSAPARSAMVRETFRMRS